MKRWVLMLAVVALALFGAACGSDDDTATDTGASEAGAQAPPVYTITATEDGDEFAFDVPDDIAGGVVSLELVSAEGNEAPHDFQLVELVGDHTVDEIVAEVSDEEAPMATWLESATGVGTVAPGRTTTVTVELKPDTEYGFFCTEQSDEGGSHAESGMSGTFTTGDDSAAEMPEGTASVVTKEYGFTFEGLKAGANTIAFTNEGKMLHHVLLVPLAEGATFDQAKEALSSEEEPEGPPPVEFEKGVFSAVAGIGDTIVYEANLAAGKYVAICFMPDKGTAGPPHVAKGMIQEVEVS